MIARRVVWQFVDANRPMETVTEGAETESAPLPAPSFNCTVPTSNTSAVPMAAQETQSCLA